MLTRLSKDRSYQVRCAVVENISTPTETLKSLCRDKENMVRIAVAENPNTPSDVLDIMARDSSNLQMNPSIYWYIALNPNVTLNTLKYIFDFLSCNNEDYLANRVSYEISKRQN